MKRAAADKALEECLEHIRGAFPPDVAFGLVLVIPTDEEPGGELAYGGTLTLNETGDVIEAYTDANSSEEIEVDEEGNAAGVYIPPNRTLN